jgi:hypothetical protein
MTGKRTRWSYDRERHVTREQQDTREKRARRTEKRARRAEQGVHQSASINQINNRTGGRNRKERRGS